MKSWLRRLAIRYLDVVPRCDYLATRHQVARLESELTRLRMDWRWANNRIDELKQLLDGYRRDAWRPVMKKALNDFQKNAEESA